MVGFQSKLIAALAATIHFDNNSIRICEMFDLVLGNTGWVLSAMACIALHSPGLIPYCATFFVFTAYMRAAMRISALCEAGVIYVITHDSKGQGEDGPTNQPIEHLISFRAMPNILMLRPADGNETAGAYKVLVAVLNKKRPSVLALSRQKLPQLAGTSMEGGREGWVCHFR